MTLREIGDWVGVTERTAHEITKELVADGYLSRSKERGRNRYTVHPEMPLRHPEMPEHDVGEMLSMLAGGRWTPPGGNSGDPGKPVERSRKRPRKSEKTGSPQGRRRAPSASRGKKG